VYTNDDARSFLIDVHWMCLDETDLDTSINLIGTKEFLDPWYENWYYMGQDELGYIYTYSQDYEPTCEFEQKLFCQDSSSCVYYDSADTDWNIWWVHDESETTI